MWTALLILGAAAAGVVAAYALIDRSRTQRQHSREDPRRQAQIEQDSQAELGMESAMPFLSSIAGMDSRA